MAIESAPVQVHILPDGRQFITDQECLEHPEVADFVKRFPSYWVHDDGLRGYVGPPAKARQAYEVGWSLERLRLWYHLSEPELPDVPGLPEDWSSLTFSALLTAIIDARRADPEFRLVGAIKVNRGLSPLSFFDWVDAGFEVTTLDFSYPPTNDSGDIFAFQEPEAHGITIQASCGAGVLLDLADWLEGRPSD